MEWNLRPSSLWEWDNLFELDGKAGENPKKFQEQRADYFVESDRGISSGSLHSPGDDGGGGGGGSGSGSDFGHASSKSSVSASINSSSIGESRATVNKKFTLDGFEPFQRDPRSEKQFGTSPTPDVSAGSGEPLLSLKLGKRMYFKDIGSETNAAASKMTPSPSVVSMSSSGTKTTVAKRSKSGSQTAITPRCQVEGCNLDLSSAKDYHRKHRICENHSKSPRVVVSGVERRFCQQCSRFHGLSEFDEKKRSCRRRLSDHNARRRKPQPEAVRLNPARFSSLYDEPPQKMSLVFDQAPRLFTRHSPNFAWGYENGGSDGSKLGNKREYLSRPAKTVLLPNNNNNNDAVTANIAMLYPHDSSRHKTTAIGSEFLHSGLEESVVSSELNTTTQDLHRALSLLSTTSSWGGSRETTKPVIVSTHHDDLLLNNTIQPPLHPMNHGGALTTSATTAPLASADFWQTAIETEPPPSAAATAPPIHSRGTTSNSTSHFQDLHLFKAPSESGFYSYHFN